MDVGIEENENRLSIYPNPTSDNFVIKSEQNISNITLYDSQGRLVLKKEKLNTNQIIIDISGLSRGIYMVQVYIDNTVVIKKLIVE